MKLKMQSIRILYNAEQNMEALYGLDMFGDVYWYRDAQYDRDTSKMLRTAGWVKLSMEMSEVITEEESAKEPEPQFPKFTDNTGKLEKLEHEAKP